MVECPDIAILKDQITMQVKQIIVIICNKSRVTVENEVNRMQFLEFHDCGYIEPHL